MAAVFQRRAAIAAARDTGVSQSRTGRLAASAGSSAPQGSHHTQNWQSEVPSEDILVTDLEDDPRKWIEDETEQNCSLSGKSYEQRGKACCCPCRMTEACHVDEQISAFFPECCPSPELTVNLRPARRKTRASSLMS